MQRVVETLLYVYIVRWNILSVSAFTFSNPWIREHPNILSTRMGNGDFGIISKSIIEGGDFLAPLVVNYTSIYKSQNEK